jgi:hypothetical protein
LASDEFYANNGKSTLKNQAANNKNISNTASNVLNITKNMTSKASNTSVKVSKDDANNTMMNESQLKSLQA